MLTCAQRLWLGMVLHAVVLVAWSAPALSIADLTMPESKVSEVAETVVVNGVPMAIYKFTANERPQDVRLFYKARLGDKVVEQRVGQHNTLGALMDKRYVMVRYETDSAQSTQGTISMADMDKAGKPPSMPDGAKAPPGSQLIFSSVSLDGGRASRLFTFVNRMLPHENAAAVKALLARAGYQLQREQGVSEPRKGNVLLFAKGAEEVMVSLTGLQGATSLVFNFTTQGR